MTSTIVRRCISIHNATVEPEESGGSIWLRCKHDDDEVLLYFADSGAYGVFVDKVVAVRSVLRKRAESPTRRLLNQEDTPNA